MTEDGTGRKNAGKRYTHIAHNIMQQLRHLASETYLRNIARKRCFVRRMANEKTELLMWCPEVYCQLFSRTISTYIDRSCFRKLRYFPVNKEFREEFEYSNYPFVLAGYSTERLRGKAWEDDVTDTIFRALGKGTSY